MAEFWNEHYGLIILILILIWIIWVIIRVVKKSSENQTSLDSEEDEVQTEDSTLKSRYLKSKSWVVKKISDNWVTSSQIIIGGAICHWLIYYFWPSWYWLMAKNPVFWIDHVLIILVFLFLRKKKKVKSEITKELTPIGTAVIVILIVGNIWTMYQWKVSGESSVPSSTSYSGIQRNTPTMTSTTPTRNTEGERRVREFWDSKLADKSEVNLMIEIAHIESDFRQFDSDGVTPLKRHNLDGSTDYGVMQINDFWWKKEMTLNETPPEVKYLDIKTWDGNLNAALYKYTKYGAKNWSSNKMAKLILYGTSYTLEAPVEGWSEKVFSVPYYSLRISYSGNVTMRNDDGKTYEDGPGIELGSIPRKYSQFRSRTGEIVTVFVTPFKQ